MFLWVFLNHRSFNKAASLYHMCECFVFSFCNGFFIRFYPFKICSITNKSMFDDLSKSTVILSLRKCLYRIYINVYQFWHIKSTYHIFICMIIYSCFSSDTAVHLCEQTCRNLYEVDSPQISSSSKSCQISGNSAAKCKEHIFSVKFMCNQKVIQIIYCG